MQFILKVDSSFGTHKKGKMNSKTVDIRGKKVIYICEEIQVPGKCGRSDVMTICLSQCLHVWTDQMY